MLLQLRSALQFLALLLECESVFSVEVGPVVHLDVRWECVESGCVETVPVLLQAREVNLL